jgi:ABC-type transport system involved in multi-copper enzyme maturation permease subunit
MEGGDSKKSQILESQSSFYRSYSGEVVSLNKRMLTILFTDFKLRIMNKWIIVLEVLAWFFIIPVFYVLYSIALLGIEFSSIIFAMFYGLIFIWLALITTVAGSRLISDDLSSNSITLYLSRPIKINHYFSGKFGSIFLLISTISLIPSIILALMVLLLTTGTSDPGYNVGLVVFTFISVGFLIALVFSSIAVVFSSMTKNHIYSGVGIFSTILFSNIIPIIFSPVTENKYVNLISVWYNLLLVADKWSGFNNIKDFDWPLPFGILLIIIFGCLGLAWYRLNRWELSE